MNAPAGSRGDGGGRDGNGQGELFEPPTFSPTYPKHTTLKGKALAILMSGRTLTHAEFQTLSKSWRLSEPIRALRHDHGWPVQTIEFPAPTPARPDRVIAKYQMPTWVVDELGVSVCG